MADLCKHCGKAVDARAFRVDYVSNRLDFVTHTSSPIYPQYVSAVVWPGVYAHREHDPACHAPKD